MRDGLDQHELLAFIEAELSPEDAAALRRRLASQPALLRRLDAMREDRASLRGLPEPVVDRDLVAELEPLLAKPMLLSDGPAPLMRPGAYRARHRRGVRWTRLAAAAGFAIVAIGGVSALAFNLLGSMDPKSDSPSVASGETTGAESPADGRVASAGRSAASEDGELHHWDAVQADLRSLDAEDADATSTPPTRDVIRLASGDHAIESAFALVLNDTSRERLVARMSTMVEDMRRASLVRNFTYDEALAAWSEMVRSTDLPAKEQLIASRDGWKSTSLTRRQKRDIGQVAERTTIDLGESLSGRDDLAPAPEQQLRFGEAGADLSVTVPARYLMAFLETLNEEFGPAVALRAFGGALSEDAVGSSDEWSRWTAWRDAVASFRDELANDESLLVVIPIVRGE